MRTGYKLRISNVCTHRGMIYVLKRKVHSTIKCPYHGRTFSLSGEIKHMPMFEVWKISRLSDDLICPKVSDWNGMLFASFQALMTIFEQFIEC